MKGFRSILVVVDQTERDAPVLAKAVALAKRFEARLELFLCDAEHEYALRHSYDPCSASKAREACLAEARRYLETLAQTVRGASLQVSVDAVCESPLYEGIVHEVQKSRPDLVIKGPGDGHRGRRLSLSDNDWQLMRTCPVPLMIAGPHTWGSPARFAAAVDVSAQETPGLARAILHLAEDLQSGSDASLDVISCKHAAASAAEREAHARTLHELATEIRLGGECIHMIEGAPEEVLPAFLAKRHYDVLILGALTHRPGLAPLVGTLTSRLVDVLDCDFVLVKPEKRASAQISPLRPAARDLTERP